MIGVIYLVVAVANLFVDFSFVQSAEAQGLSAEGEWYAAFSIMLALVMVYIAMLRILGRTGARLRNACEPASRMCGPLIARLFALATQRLVMCR